MHLRLTILLIVALLLAMIRPGPVFAQDLPSMRVRPKSSSNPGGWDIDTGIYDLYGAHGKARYGKRASLLGTLTDKTVSPNSEEQQFIPLVYVLQMVRLNVAEQSDSNEQSQQPLTKEHPEVYLNRRPRY